MCLLLFKLAIKANYFIVTETLKSIEIFENIKYFPNLLAMLKVLLVPQCLERQLKSIYQIRIVVVVEYNLLQ